MRYEVFENIIKESVTEKFIKKYYTIKYQCKKYNFFGSLVWKEYSELIGHDEYPRILKFNDYNKALAKCNDLNSKWESEWEREEFVVSNGSYRIEKNVLRNESTGVVIDEYYYLWWKFLFIWIPWMTFDNYEKAMLHYARCVNGLSDTYVSSRSMSNG